MQNRAKSSRTDSGGRNGGRHRARWRRLETTTTPCDGAMTHPGATTMTTGARKRSPVGADQHYARGQWSVVVVVVCEQAALPRRFLILIVYCVCGPTERVRCALLVQAQGAECVATTTRPYTCSRAPSDRRTEQQRRSLSFKGSGARAPAGGCGICAPLERRACARWWWWFMQAAILLYIVVRKRHLLSSLTYTVRSTGALLAV